MNRTDLAMETVLKSKISEGITLEKGVIQGLHTTKVNVTEKGSGIIGKPEGEYLTIFCDDRDENTEIDALSEVLSDFLEKSVSPSGHVLVAGLGNENITPDSLGVRSVSRIVATAHLAVMPEFNELGMRGVFAVETGVLAQTGLESSEQLKYIVSGIKPELILVIDSLACSDTERLGRTIQVTNTGISPGSGVKNSRQEISKKTMNIPVIAIGVPTVIDLESLADNGMFSEECAETITAAFTEANAMVVPRDIDVTINHFAKVISKSINRVLNPSLSQEEMERLLF